MRKIRSWLTVALIVMTCPAALAVELTQAEIHLSDAASPPPDDAAWRRQALPDLWSNSRPGVHGYGWYRLTFQHAETGDHDWAVLLSRYCMNAAVYLNGRFIGSGGRLEPPLARNWNRPLYLPLPPDALRPGSNTIHVRLASEQSTQAMLFPVTVERQALLWPRYERLYFLNISLSQATSLIIAAIGLLMLSLWWRRRQDSAHGYFGLAAVAWAAQSTNLYVRDIAMTTRAWEILVHSGMQVFGALFFISLLRFTQTVWPGLERLLWSMLALAPLTLWVVPAEWFLSASLLWHLCLLVSGVLVLGGIARAAVHKYNREARLLLLAVGVAMLFGVHDWLIHSKMQWYQQIAGWIPQDLYLTHYSAPMLFMVVGWIMTGRFVRMSNRLEILNADLEARVQQKHMELADNFARLQALERERAVLQERERIYRDLHDDVGAKLLSLVYRAGSPYNADLARSALQDLRDIVSSSAREPALTEHAFADWRAECEERLSAAGIALEWDDSGLPGDLLLSQEATTHIGRILREAINNVIRHAQPKKVRVIAAVGDEYLTVFVIDDGVGCDVNESPDGRGRRNMRQRASRVGARIAWLPTDSRGCTVRLDIPLNARMASGGTSEDLSAKAG